MLWLTIRELRGRPWRALLTGLAAVIGVGLISGALVLLDTAEGAGNPDGDVEQLGQVVLVAGGVALLVGGFIINAAFTATLAQRTRELALLRCLGADARGLRRMVRLEATIIGAAASLVGIAFGVIVAAALRLFVTRLVDAELSGNGLSVSPRTVLISVGAGLVVTVISALVPARRATRPSPLAVLHDRRVARDHSPAVFRSAIGVVTAVAGLGAVPLAVITETGYLLLPGAALTLIGARLLGPRFAAPLVGIAGFLIARTVGLPGDLARRNARRNPDRTAGTASALMIGLALFNFVAVLSASTKAEVLAEASGVADFQIHPPRRLEPPPIKRRVVARLATLPEFSSVVPVMAAEGTVSGAEAWVTALDPADFSRVWELDVVAGSVSGLTTGEIGVTDDVAAANHWTIGSPVEVGLPRGTRTLTVNAIYAGNSYVDSFTPNYMMLPSDYVRLGGDRDTLEVSMKTAEGVTPQAARRAIGIAVARNSTLIVEDGAQVRDQVVEMINRATSLYLALTGLAALIGLFGIANTTALSIVDRIRELGLLRAVGMERRQIRSMIRAEALIVAVVGAELGTVIGTFFAWGAAGVLEHSSAPTRFTVPVATLALAAAAAATAGVVAAVLPAQWASRVDLPRALAAE